MYTSALQAPILLKYNLHALFMNSGEQLYKIDWPGGVMVTTLACQSRGPRLNS